MFGQLGNNNISVQRRGKETQKETMQETKSNDPVSGASKDNNLGLAATYTKKHQRDLFNSSDE